MIEDADEDGSGSINFPEFVGLMMKKQEGSISKDEIKQVWSIRFQIRKESNLFREILEQSNLS